VTAADGSDRGARVPIEDVLDLGDGEIDLTPLVARAAEVDIDAGMFADEEIHWMSGGADATPDPFLDAPRLGLLPTREQDVALETAFWMLSAQGAIVHDADGEPELAGLYAVIGELRTESEAAVSVRIDTRAAGVQRLALYRIRHDLFLCEIVEEAGGLHHFTFRSTDRQVRWLAAVLDPGGRADTTGEPQQARELDELDPHPDALAERCEVAAHVTLGERGPEGPGPLRAFTSYSGPDGVVVQTGWRAGEESAVALQRLGPEDLLGFLAGFLSRQPTAS
jgi:hypothetical protein